MRINFDKMNTKASILVFLLGASLSTIAQRPQVPIADRVAQPLPQKCVAGVEIPSSISTPPPLTDNQFNPSAQAGVLSCVDATIIGYTQYDLQSNSSVDNRLIADQLGVQGTWTMSLELTPFFDRGTGFNESDNEGWEEIPYERIESIRTGWPSIGVTTTGRQVIVSHPGIADPLHMAWRDAGTQNWSEASVPSELEVGKLWPRMAIGGVDGNSLHVICITTPTANGGMLHNNQDGALLYYRSQDGGNSWDIIDNGFVELDSANFSGFDGDSYAIHTRGNTVAFAVFNDFSDSFVMISQDNGLTWEKQLLVDFPIDLYEIDAGLPEGEEFAEDYDGDGLFQEYFNTDGAGAVHVDPFGLVHVSYGSMYYMDADTIDGTTSYFPGTNGLAYWNESMGPDSAQIIGYSYDYNESGTLDFDEIAAYYVGCASFSSIGSDATGNLYVTYSALMENFSTGAQNYRHLFLVHSTDGGMSWNADDALDLTPDEEYDGYEAVFGCMAPDVVNGKINLTYQRDFEPGLHVRGDEDPADINDIVHLSVPIELVNGFDLCLTGCTDPAACDYNPNALEEDGSCEYQSCAGCMDAEACNFDPTATLDDGSCGYTNCGCMDAQACNYDPAVEFDDGSCCECIDGTLPPTLLGVWQFDTSAGALSVGPTPLSDEWYSSPEDGLEPTLLDDRWTFTESNMLIYDNSGTTLNPFEGYVETAVEWDPWVFEMESAGGILGLNGFTVLSETSGICGWMGVWDSGPNYEIVELTETTLVILSQIQSIDCVPSGGYFTLRFVRSEPYEANYCIAGCTDLAACNYNPQATIENNESCTYPGCLDPDATNFEPEAGCADECIYLTYDCASIGNDAWSVEPMGLYPDWQEAMHGVAWEGEWVFNVPATMIEPGSGVSYGVHHVDWLSMEGMPDWATATSFDGGEAMGASTQHCIAAFGTPTAPGMHTITATAEVFISIFGQPFSVGEQSFSATLEVMANPNPIPGCTYPLASNYLLYATLDDGGCEYWGCTDAEAANFNPFANVDDGSCGEACDPAGDSTCQADNDGDGIISVSDLLILLGEFGSACE